MTGTASAPYSTGGGGVRLEHRYAATLLTAMLAGDPVAELGDDATVDAVRLQASDISAIDDIVVTGRSPSGEARRVAIGVRRNPTLTSSDEKSVPLVRAFLTVVTDNWVEVAAGRSRLALAVGVASSAASQVAELARLARAADSAADFAAALARPGATNAAVRARLGHLRALVRTASKDVPALETVGEDELTWRWLHALRVRQLRLEGADETDRTAAVASLRHVVLSGTLAAADAVFAALAEMTGEWAAAGARVTQVTLRQALVAHTLVGSRRYARAWEVLDGLGRRLRQGTRSDLQTSDAQLELPRDDERARLSAALRAAGSAAAVVVVTGEPDVGKSALTLRAVEELRDAGGATTALSLRDLPERVVDIEHLLGAPLPDVFAASAAAPTRLLVIDGAEAVLDRHREVLRELAAAALAAGIGVVGVTRQDGASRVMDVLQAVTGAAGTTAPVEHEVPRLTAPERQTLVQTFRSLTRLGAERRAEWLVGRPGLVDVLLQAGPIVDSTDLLSEADVFAAVWNGLIRNHEERDVHDAWPDDRENAAVAAARRTLRIPSGAASAVGAASLRSDGVLRAPANPALGGGDEFATDLLRDFALGRLFIIDGWDPLVAASAPRWTIRAVRLACQARLRPDGRDAAWRELRNAFDHQAQSDGQRWSEVPFEALLTLGDALQAIAEIWDQLIPDDAAGLRTLLRLAQLWYVSSAGFGDAYVLAPIVANAFLTDDDLGQHARYTRHGSVGEKIRDVVLAWLRGMAKDGVGPDPLRQQVRDRILADQPSVHDEFAVEALATLGPDLDAAAERWLRQLADESPNRLRVAVESIGAIMALTRTRWALLLELAEAYYVEKPDPEDDQWGGGFREDGIRDMQHGIGLGAPFAAYYLGPFAHLLNAAPVAAIGMINRMLDHAALYRVERPRRSGGRGRDASADVVDGLLLPHPGDHERRYCGDAAVWCWYRGSTVGPYPCMSALLAVERFADHLIGELAIPMRNVLDLLLRDCHNLAMPGLVVGLLTRHREKAGDLLDPWLAHPAVWSLEFGRVTHESWHAQGPDDAEVPGRERRRMTPRDSAAEMTVRAAAAGDQARLDALAVVANQLVENARAELAGSDHAADRLVVIEGWASTFSPDAYQVEVGDDGYLVVQHEPPPHITQALEPSNEDLKAGNEALRLQLAYAFNNDSESGWPTERLVDDIAVARELQADPPTSAPLYLEDVAVAVAAAAIVAHATSLAVLSDDDLTWATATALAGAVHPRVDFMSYAQSTYPMGGDRAAARVVPLLLLEPFDRLALDREAVEDALTALATSLYDEVRLALVSSCATAFAAPCTPDETRTCQRHPPIWAAVQQGLADCRMGPWNFEAQRRLPEHVPAPYELTIPEIPADQLLVNRLTMPLLATAEARAAACIGNHAGRLQVVLLDAHRRGLDHGHRRGYDHSGSQHEAVTRLLAQLAVGGNTEPMLAHLGTFAGNAQALQLLLRDLATLFTYDDHLRPALTEVWTLALRTILDTVNDGATLSADHHWDDWAIAAMLPTPQLRMADKTPDATLARAGATWISPEALCPLIDRWMRLAIGHPKAADAVAQLARTTSMTWQISTGLQWLEQVVDARYDQFANLCWFVTNWLGEVRDAVLVNLEALARWRRLIDGFAGAGDRRAVDLQRLDE